MFKIFAVSFVLSAVIGTSSAEYEDTGLGKSLFFEPSKRFTFHEGRDVCRSSGGDLWIPDNDQELDWFQRRFPESSENQTIKWIGLIKGQLTGDNSHKPQWIDGRLLWTDNFPNWEMKDLCKSTCCAYRLGGRLPGANPQFWGENCDLRRSVVCEKKDIPKDITFVEVPHFGKSFNYDESVQLSYHASIARCVKNGGKLWLPGSEEESLHIVKDVVKKGSAWLGAFQLIPGKDDFYSFDGRLIARKFEDKAENPNCKDQCCGQFVNYLNIVPRETVCSAKFGVVCERPIIQTLAAATTIAPTTRGTMATTRKTTEVDNGNDGTTTETKDNRQIAELIKNLSNRFDVLDKKLSEQKTDYNDQLKKTNEQMEQLLQRLDAISSSTTNGKVNQNVTCSPAKNCYYANNARRNFNEARLYCLESGGRLPTLKAREEQIWFAQTFQERSDVWLGAKKGDGSANYRFLDGSELISSNSNWKRGARDCVAQCCAVLSHYPYGQWIGENCTNYAHVTICEKN